MTVFVDVGGTKTRVWSGGFKKSFPTDLQTLPASLKRLRRRHPGKFLSRFNDSNHRRTDSMISTNARTYRHYLKFNGAVRDCSVTRSRAHGSWIKTFQDDEIVIGLRGVWTPTEKKSWQKKFRGLAKHITVRSDIELAHHLAFRGKPGIVLNAGTGSIAYGKNTRGKTARAGGLGPLLGDEGSAFWIGREYLKALYQKEGNLNRIRKFAPDQRAVPKIANLSKAVLKKAQRAPRSMERKIVRKALNHLVDLVRAVRKELRMHRNAPVHLSGGLFENKFFKRLWRRSQPRA